ncbi:MAG TPA: hypothetical protein VFH61_02145 [Thermoleophilia bacterium]|nr:hypothetical protein [Thermoleophilia bacterium]
MAQRVDPDDGKYTVTLGGQNSEMTIAGSTLRWPSGSLRCHTYTRVDVGVYEYEDNDWDPVLVHQLVTMDNGTIISTLKWQPYGMTSKTGTYVTK